jgi:type III restriction enzyme
MSNLVENPILNSAFEEPARYHHFAPGKEAEVRDGRRSAQYLMARRERHGGVAQILHEYVELELVNRIRKRVKAWREAGYPGVTRVTKELLDYWRSSDRERRFFFCQLEAVETVVFLTEGPAKEKVGIEIPKEHPDSDLPRWCCKMATGSGKTVVMAMLIAWQVLNKLANRQDARFSDSVLVVCPNLTVRDRLRGQDETKAGKEPERPLIPNAKGNYFERFDVVPPPLRALLAQGRVLVTNWHAFALQDDTKKRSVTNRGVESDTAFCDRVLKDLDELRKASNILVLNDEAHHAYRFYAADDGDEEELLGEEIESDYSQKDEEERARVWIEGLDRIHKVRGIRRIVDLTATPYFLKASGRIEGEPFDWIVSDFGLLDAIECGIVKVPHVPTWDNRGQLEPKYKRLYQEVKSRLPRSEKEVSQAGQGVGVIQEVQDALETLATQWKKDRQDWERIGREVPPVMIVVCNNTAVAALIADYLSGEGKYIKAASRSAPELRNDGRLCTLRIDSELLKKADIKKANQTQEEAAKELREIVTTVGKRGEKGEQIRCVVSVGMLSEGWDANNVTQILGLRAFSSPLLCEQVIGRGLRRYNYDVDPDGYFPPESCDIYGIPFEVLPMAKVGAAGGTERTVTVVKSDAERQRQHEILFPRVVSYVSDVKYRIKIDIDALEPVIVTPEEAPTLVGVSSVVDDRSMPQTFHDRSEFYENNRVQSAIFAVAARVTANLRNRLLFPQVLNAVKEYWRKKVQYSGKIDEREACLERYINLVTQNISDAIRSDDEEEQRFLPVLDPYRPIGSTNGVFFQTSLHCVKTVRSHVSHIACHSKVWERDLAVHLERHPAIQSYVRNYRLDFSIPYQWTGQTHQYVPDFIVRIRRSDGTILHLVLEVKGMEDNVDRIKITAARKWVDAVNNWGKLGAWDYAVVKDMAKTEEVIDPYAHRR